MTNKRADREECGKGDLLVTVLYGEATRAERADFDAHASSCATCADELAAFGGVREALQGWDVERVPAIRVEVRPGFWERFRQALAILPSSAKWVAAGAAAMLLLAVANTNVSVGPNGVAFQTSLMPRGATTAAPPTAAPSLATGGTAIALTQEQLDRLIAERTDATVRVQLAQYRDDLDRDLKELQLQLVSAQSSGDVQRLSRQVAAQRRKIDELQRDIDQSAGYGGSDLFSAVLSQPEPGT